METETEDKFTLFTNIQFVTINGVRTHTHALLLEDTESLFARKDRCYQLRGSARERRARGAAAKARA